MPLVNVDIEEPEEFTDPSAAVAPLNSITVIVIGETAPPVKLAVTLVSAFVVKE